MEAIVAQPVEDGQESKSPTAAVSEVLGESTKFLERVGLETPSHKNSRRGVSSRVEELEAELHIEKQGASQLRDQLEAQQQDLDALKKKAEESEAAREKSLEELGFLKDKIADTDALLRRLLNCNQGQVNPTP